MSSLLSATGLKGEALSNRFRLVAAGAFIAVLFIGLAAVFLGVAAYMALAAHFEPWLAALIVAGVAALVAGVAILVAVRQADRLASEVNVAVKSSAVALVAPTALRVARSHFKITVGVLAAGGLLALWRARASAGAKASATGKG
jgi:divalent metal cation (Fe/Co/Zn/Cd) transporter